MPSLVIPNVHASDLPPDWARLLLVRADTYRVTIEPSVDSGGAGNGLSLAMAMAGMEDEEGPEYGAGDITETWTK